MPRPSPRPVQLAKGFYALAAVVEPLAGERAVRGGADDLGAAAC